MTVAGDTYSIRPVLSGMVSVRYFRLINNRTGNPTRPKRLFRSEQDAREYAARRGLKIVSNAETQTAPDSE